MRAWALLPLLTIAAAPPAAHVDMQRMSEVTRVLASDDFQGRAPGTPGEEKTIPYLIEQFKAAGLEPAGENGGWTQTVPMIRTQLQTPMAVSFSQGSQTIRRPYFLLNSSNLRLPFALAASAIAQSGCK